jgi:hypothetical protein
VLQLHKSTSAVECNPSAVYLDSDILYYLVVFLNVANGDDPTIEVDEINITVTIG